jgi:hypothetical protein
MKNILPTVLSIFLLTPSLALAQQNLVNLPIGETGDFNDYINAVYLMFISIAALIAVVKIIIAGVKYMFSDIVTQKSDAKNDIKGALLGLLVVLSAVVILTIINPDLTTFDPDITRTEPREQQTINNTPTTLEISTVCARTSCTTEDNTYSEETSIVISRENSAELSNFNNACLNENNVSGVTVNPSNNSQWLVSCTGLNESEADRISSIFTAQNPTEDPEITESRITGYTNRIVPFLDENMDADIVFSISGDYNIGYAIQYCNDLGGTPNRNIVTGSLTSTFRCE